MNEILQTFKGWDSAHDTIRSQQQIRGGVQQSVRDGRFAQAEAVITRKLDLMTSEKADMIELLLEKGWAKSVPRSSDTSR